MLNFLAGPGPGICLRLGNLLLVVPQILVLLLFALVETPCQGREVLDDSRSAGSQSVAGDFTSACHVFDLSEGQKEDEACRRIAQEVSSGKLEAAERAATELRDKYPQNGIGVYWLGQVDFKRAKYISAVRNFELAVDRSPTVVAAHVALGLCYASIQQYRLFEKEMLWVIDHVPEEAFPYYHLGRYYFLQLNQTDRGADYLQNALKRDPKDYRASYYLGYYFELKGKWDQAKGFYTQSADTIRMREASYGASMEGLSRILLHEEHLPEAIRLAEEAVAIEPSLASAHLLLGKLWIQTGDLTKGIVELQKAAEFDPTNEAPHYQLYRAYMKLGDRSQAETEQALFLKIRSVYSGE